MAAALLESTVPFYSYTLDVYDTMAATAYTKAFNNAQFYKSNQWYTNKCLKFAHMLILCITVVYRHINTLNFEIGT